MPEQTCELDDSDEEENIFHAQVLNTEAPPPPHLPLELLQALGTGPCQMHPTDVSEDALDYDSTNDSVE